MISTVTALTVATISFLGACCSAFYYLTGGFKHITEILKNKNEINKASNAINIIADEENEITEEKDSRSDYEKYMAETFVKFRLADGADGKIWIQG